jgi:hypothetical protein
MKVTVKRPVEIEVDSVRIEVQPRCADEDLPANFPGRDGEMWCATVNIDTGQIEDWPQGHAHDLYTKVCDCGSYYLQSGGTIIASIEQDYVPSIVPNDYGDYLRLNIDATGRITNWDASAGLDEFFPPDED